MSVSATDFKRAMGLRAGAVAIVTACSGGLRRGMTVTDWAGVSAEPPLALVCAEKSSKTRELIEAGGCFAINVLRAGQEALSQRFAAERDEMRRFDGLALETGTTGAPLLPDVLASLDCRLQAAHDAGDHVIYLGRVEEIATGEGEPLLYFSGRYRGLATERRETGA